MSTMGRHVWSSKLVHSLLLCGLWGLNSGCNQGLCGKHLYPLIQLADLYVIFHWKTLCLDFCFKRNTLGPIPTMCTMKWLVHLFLELNSPQSYLFPFLSPASYPTCSQCSGLQILVTSLGSMLSHIQRMLTIFFQVVQMFWVLFPL